MQADTDECHTVAQRPRVGTQDRGGTELTRDEGRQSQVRQVRRAAAQTRRQRRPRLVLGWVQRYRMVHNMYLPVY